MLRPTYPIVTPRLLLRPFTMDDCAAFYAIRSRSDVVRYLYEEPITLVEVNDLMPKRMQRTALVDEGDVLGLALERRDTGEMIGDVVLIWTSVAHQQGELGFVLHPDHHRQGFAREAPEAILKLGFTAGGMHRIVGRCDARNAPSAGLLLHLGMRQEALLRQNEFVKGEWCDEAIYAILADEWRAQQAMQSPGPGGQG